MTAADCSEAIKVLAFVGDENARALWNKLDQDDGQLFTMCHDAIDLDPALVASVVRRADDVKQVGSGRAVPSPPVIPQPRAGGSNGGDLDCDDIGHEVWVGGDDPHGLDGDGDGWGCESW